MAETALILEDQHACNNNNIMQQQHASTWQKPLSFSRTNSSDASRAKKALRDAMGEIEAFYGPYNAMLERLVHPAFRWDRTTHELR